MSREFPGGSERWTVIQVPSPAFKCNVMSSTGKGLCFTSSPSLREAWSRPSFRVQGHRNSNDMLGRQLPKCGEPSFGWSWLVSWGAEVNGHLADIQSFWSEICWVMQMSPGISLKCVLASEVLCFLLQRIWYYCDSFSRSVLLYLKPLLPRGFHCLVATAC